MRRKPGKSGREGENNVEAFEHFLLERKRKKDWEGYLSPGGTRLLRKKIYEECKFGRSALRQNPCLCRMFEAVEADLANQGVIKKSSSNWESCDTSAYTPDEVSSEALESRLDELEKVISEVQRVVIDVEATADRYAELAKPYLERLVKPIGDNRRKKRRRKS